MSPAPILATRDDEQPLVEQEPGLRYRLRAGASTGAQILTVVDRWLDPGKGLPLHRHPDGVEEVVWVLSGHGEFEVDGEVATVGPEHTVIIPAGSVHRYTATGEETLHLIVRFSSIRPVMVGEGVPPDTLEIQS